MTLPPALTAILFAILLIALMLLMLWGGKLLVRVGSGWKLVQERFPARMPQESGDAYKGQFGGIVRGFTSFSLRGLSVGVVPSGVYLYPTFARRNPCFIPWSSIRRAAVRGASIHVTVEYEQSFDFTLPSEALRVLEAHLGQDKIQRLPSVPAVLAGLAGLGAKESAAIGKKGKL